MNGGRTKDGGSVVGASVFYSSPPEESSSSENLSEVEKLSQELTVSGEILHFLFQFTKFVFLFMFTLYVFVLWNIKVILKMMGLKNLVLKLKK